MLDPIHALERLEIGNKRFVENASALDITSARRRELSKGQDPYAIVLGCADSRVPTEVVFDETLVADLEAFQCVDWVEHRRVPLQPSGRIPIACRISSR